MRVIARLLGKISSSFAGVLEGRMHYRKLERFKMLALARNRGKHETKISLSVEAMKSRAFSIGVILNLYITPSLLQGRAGGITLLCLEKQKQNPDLMEN